MLCALSVLMLYLSSIAPTLRLALIAIAGILPAVIVLRFGLASGFTLYAAVSILALLILPDKGTALLYIFLFGHYPMFKYLIERLNKMALEWVFKLALFNVLSTAILMLFTALVTDVFASMTDRFPSQWAIPILYLAGNVAFVIYDIGFTGLISAFEKRLRKI